MKYPVLFNLLLLIVSLSCNNIDFSNPENVINQYANYTFIQKDTNKAYELLADTCKSMLTYKDFIELQNEIEKDEKLKSVSSIDIEPEYYNLYRRYEIKTYKIKAADTVYYYYYYTLFKDNYKNKWGIILLKENSIAKKLLDKSNYPESIEQYNNLLAIDPFSSQIYAGLCKSYYGNRDIESAKKYLNKRIRYSPHSPYNINLQSIIYMGEGNYDLGFDILKKGFESSNDDSLRLYYAATIGGLSISLKDYDQAKEYLYNSYIIDSLNSYVLWHLGKLYEQYVNEDSSLLYYTKAIKNINNLELGKQKLLYYDFANFLISNPIKNDSGDLTYDYSKAKKNLLNAIELDNDYEDAKETLKLLYQNDSAVTKILEKLAKKKNK